MLVPSFLFLTVLSYIILDGCQSARHILFHLPYACWDALHKRCSCCAGRLYCYQIIFTLRAWKCVKLFRWNDTALSDGQFSLLKIRCATSMKSSSQGTAVIVCCARNSALLAVWRKVCDILQLSALASVLLVLLLLRGTPFMNFLSETKTLQTWLGLIRYRFTCALLLGCSVGIKEEVATKLGKLGVLLHKLLIDLSSLGFTGLTPRGQCASAQEDSTF